MKIKLIFATWFNKKIYSAGSEITVDDAQAKLWVKQGRAMVVLESDAHEEKKSKPRSRKSKT